MKLENEMSGLSDMVSGSMRKVRLTMYARSSSENRSYFSKYGTNKLPGAIGTNKLPEPQIIGSSYSRCDLNQFLAATGSNYLPQVYRNRAISNSNFSPNSAFWNLPLPEVQIGT